MTWSGAKPLIAAACCYGLGNKTREYFIESRTERDDRGNTMLEFPVNGL